MKKIEIKKYCKENFEKGVSPKDIAVSLGELGVLSNKGKPYSKAYVYSHLKLRATKHRKDDTGFKKKNVPAPRTSMGKIHLIKHILETNALATDDKIAMALLVI